MFYIHRDAEGAQRESRWSKPTSSRYHKTEDQEPRSCHQLGTSAQLAPNLCGPPGTRFNHLMCSVNFRRKTTAGTPLNMPRNTEKEREKAADLTYNAITILFLLRAPWRTPKWGFNDEEAYESESGSRYGRGSHRSGSKLSERKIGIVFMTSTAVLRCPQDLRV